MSRKAFLALLVSTCCVCFSGCVVTGGVYLQKDWDIDSAIKSPDMHTQLKLEFSKDFSKKAVK